MPIKGRIRTIPDYPKKGIMFRDITSLIKDPVGFRLTIDNLTQRYVSGELEFDTIVGIESRGFILGGAMAYTLGKGFVPIRKKGKLPGKTVKQEYQLEYGTDIIEIHDDALKKGASDRRSPCNGRHRAGLGHADRKTWSRGCGDGIHSGPSRYRRRQAPHGKGLQIFRSDGIRGGLARKVYDQAHTSPRQHHSGSHAGTPGRITETGSALPPDLFFIPEPPELTD